MLKIVLFILPLVTSCDSLVDEEFVDQFAELEVADLANADESLESSVNNEFAVPDEPPSLNKGTCCFKCVKSGWYNEKLNKDCYAFALGFCKGKHQSKVQRAEWTSDCPAD